MKKKKEWLRYYINTVLPVLIVIALLGSMMTVFLLYNAHQDVRRDNMHVLRLVDDNVNEIMGERDYYTYFLWPNTQIMVMLKRILSNETYSYTESREQELIRIFVSTPVYTELYLHSAYIYYAGYDKVIISEQGLVETSDFFDQEWLAMVNGESSDIPEVMKRNMKRYAFEEGTQVVSISKKYYTSKNHKNYGIVTLNLLVDKVNERLERYVSSDDQIIYVSYKTGEVLFRTKELSGIDDGLIRNISESGKDEMIIPIDGRRYSVYKMNDEQLGVTCISMVPLSAEMKLALPVLGMVFCVIIFTAVFGIILSWIMTRRRYALQNKVDAIIEYYEKSGTYPEDMPQMGEEYDYFFQNILKIFGEHKLAIIQDYEKQIQLERAEIKSLQMQINPHFLYNTLETIYWKVMEVAKGYSPVNQMIENLSDILRYSLSGSDNLVKLQGEMLIAEKYIQIQKMRFGDSFEVIYCKDESCMDVKVPKLFLQPLIENAIQHGLLCGYEEKRRGKIKIRARDLGKEAVISVIDNGTGISESNLKELQRLLKNGKTGEEHIGLFNTNQRICLQFGEQYKIKLYSKAGVGTVIKIRVPKER